MRAGKPPKADGNARKLPVLERRARKAERREARQAKRRSAENLATGKEIPVNLANLAPNNSYGVPEFVARGTYRDLPFACKDCGKPQVWTAAQQKWWYESAKGFAYSTATRCRPCRKRRRGEKVED